jgi:hypothetical protein
VNWLVGGHNLDVCREVPKNLPGLNVDIEVARGRDVREDTFLCPKYPRCRSPDFLFKKAWASNPGVHKSQTPARRDDYILYSDAKNMGGSSVCRPPDAENFEVAHRFLKKCLPVFFLTSFVLFTPCIVYQVKKEYSCAKCVHTFVSDSYSTFWLSH